NPQRLGEAARRRHAGALAPADLHRDGLLREPAGRLVGEHVEIGPVLPGVTGQRDVGGEPLTGAGVQRDERRVRAPDLGGRHRTPAVAQLEGDGHGKHGRHHPLKSRSIEPTEPAAPETESATCPGSTATSPPTLPPRPTAAPIDPPTWNLPSSPMPNCSPPSAPAPAQPSAFTPAEMPAISIPAFASARAPANASPLTSRPVQPRLALAFAAASTAALAWPVALPTGPMSSEPSALPRARCASAPALADASIGSIEASAFAL